MEPDDEQKIEESPVKTIVEQEFVLTPDLLETYKNHPIIKDIIKKHFYKLPTKYYSELIEKILIAKKIIFTDYVEPNHHIFKKIKSKITDNYELKPLYYFQIRNDIIKKLNLISKGLENQIEENEDEEEIIENNKRIKINKNITKKELFIKFCDEDGRCDFIYDFNNRDLPISVPTTSDKLQICKIQISSMPIAFGIAVEHHYECPDKYATNPEDLCDSSKVITRKVYSVESVNGKIQCPGKMHYTTPDGKCKIKKCGKTLSPIERSSIFVNGYYYDVSYENNEGVMKNCSAYSFKELMPGYYDAAIFSNIGNYRMQTLQIIDVKEAENIQFDLPEKKPGINYLLSLQEAIDNFIDRQCGIKIYGLIPIKLCFLLQKIASIYGYSLNFNIDFTGSKSVGKSLLMKYYGICLYNYSFLSSNGLSISVPALRGTTDKVLVMDKEVNINRIGFLGTYKNIHIDEAGENGDLVQQLKTFLSESNYINSMARADGISRKRTAHVNITKNLNNEHLGIYRGGIKKIYDNSNIIDGTPLEPWNHNWDLFQPLDSYDNIYLKNAIKKQRDKFSNSQKWWIDGSDLALHDRFPFFFDVEDDNNENLKNILKDNVSKRNLEEIMYTIKRLKNNDIDNYIKSTFKTEDLLINEDFLLVDKILAEYNIVVDSRIQKIYYLIIKISMLINQRIRPEKEDYDLLRYILENTNRKTTITELEKYQIRGPFIVKYHNIIDKNANNDFVLQDNDDNDVMGDFK